MIQSYGSFFRSRKLRWTLAGLASIALVIGACEGDNAFSETGVPRIISASVPTTATAGDSIAINVGAFGPRLVSSIRVSFTGAFTGDTVINIEPPATTASKNVRIKLPDLLTDTTITVRITARDAVGQSSQPVTTTIKASAPPAIIGVDAPDSVMPGIPLTLRVRAVSLRNVKSILVGLRGATVKDSTVTIAVPAKDVIQTITLNIPASLNDTTVTVLFAGVDDQNVVGPTAAISLPVVVGPPEIISVTSAQGETVLPGATVDLRVVAKSLREVAELRVSFRNGVVKDTVIEIDPSQTNVTRDFSVSVPANTTDSIVTVRVTAVDKIGGLSNVTTKILHITQGGPQIVTLSTPDQAQAGRTMDVRVVATGTRPITNIMVQLRGAVDRDLPIQVNPPSTNTTQDLSILLPDTVRDTVMVVRATATDQAGVVSGVATKTVRVVDASAPSVIATLGATQIGAGRQLPVRVQATDNVSLQRVGFLVLNDANVAIDSMFALIATGRTRDTTFSYTVSPALQPQTLRFQGFAIDRQGLRGLSTAVQIGVVDSTAPTITTLAPAAGTTAPLGDSILVRVRVQDASGVKAINISGVAIRQDSLSGSTVVQKFNSKSITFPQAPQTTLPRDTTIVRYLTGVPNDSISEPVSIIVSASDSIGNVRGDTTVITVGGPRVDIRTPANGTQAQVNQPVQVSLFALDRTSGIDSLSVTLFGAGLDTTKVYRGLASPDSVVLDTLFTPTTTGTLAINATAWNRRGVPGRATQANVTVVSTAVADTAKPRVALQLNTATRVELDDSIQVVVSAQDQGASGVIRTGIVVLALPDTAIAGGGGFSAVQPDTIYIDSIFASGRSGVVQKSFQFTLGQFPYLETSTFRLPRKFTLQVHAFAVDADGNCGANNTGTLAALNCDTIDAQPGNFNVGATARPFYVARNVTGLSTVVTGVTGQSIALPSGSRIADAVVDTVTKRLFLSNIARNKVEILSLTPQANQNVQVQLDPAGISVGSQPWGMYVAKATADPTKPDTLMVANSGGTNISFVPIETSGTLIERTQNRLLTPNNVLFEITRVDDNGKERYTYKFYDFSDRPQFVGQDSNKVILFSTTPTASARDGTVRYAVPAPAGGVPEVRILFNRGAIQQTSNVFALAHIDSVQIQPGGSTDDLINIWDHEIGRPTARCSSGYMLIEAAIAQMYTAGMCGHPTGSDMFVGNGTWDLDGVGMSDTTFIAVSNNRGVVGFGEGVEAVGRILLWQPKVSGYDIKDPGSVSDEISVQDLIGNASERVVGLGLDSLGELGVARGNQSVYYFSQNVNQTGDLRLQGLFSDAGVAGGNGGAALHPYHRYNGDNLISDEQTLSFAATGNQTIKIIETVHFNQVGEIPVRDNIVGQLRASPPLPGDNTGLSATACNRIVVRLYGVSAAGNAVVTAVRLKDLDRRPETLPDRNSCTPS